MTGRITDERLAQIRLLADTPVEFGAAHNTAQSALASSVPELLDEIDRLRTLNAEIERRAQARKAAS